MNRFADYSPAAAGHEQAVPTQQTRSYYTLLVLAFWLVHLPLGVVVRSNPLLATLHAYAVLGIGLFLLLRNRKPEEFLYALIYLATAETLWRTRAYIFYEYSKYTVSGLLILAAVWQGRLLKGDRKALLYFLFLLPSILIMADMNRRDIAFNLSGPFVIAVSVFYFSTSTIPRNALRNIMVIGLGPILALLGNAAYSTAIADEISFVQASNYITAGGYGPNQISAMLGLGALLAFLIAITFSESRLVRLVSFGLSVWLLAQSALTFSRGGFFAALGAIVLAAFLLLQDRRARNSLLLVGAVGVTVFALVVFPLLDDFTGGQLLVRLQDPDTTGRDEAATVDIQLFLENPMLGVGPGQSDAEHARLFRETRAHTEYTRLLAEHGLFGLMAMVLLLAMLLLPLLRPATPVSRAYKVIFVAWGLVTLAHISTRMAVPGVVLGLGVAQLLVDVPAAADPAKGEAHTPPTVSFVERLRWRYLDSGW